MTAFPRIWVAACCGPLVYLLVTAAIAALLAYPVFIVSHADDISFFRSLVSRGGQGLLILGLLPLFRWLSLPVSTLGFGRGFLRQLGVGLMAGCIMLSLHVLGLLALDVREVVWTRLTMSWLLPALGKALLTGLAVAMLEEIIFRGALLGAVQKYAGPLLAILVSAFYYASLHFIGTLWSTGLADVGWDTGFRIAADGFSHLLQAPPDAWLGLFVAGMMLGCVRVIVPCGLGYCIGLHAGWVTVIKLGKPLTYFNPKADYAFLVGSYDTFIGLLSASWLSLLTLLMGLTFYFRNRRGGVRHG
jgi:hypothetical protein